MSLRFNALHRASGSSVKELMDAIFLCRAQRKYATSLCCQQVQLEIHVVEIQHW